MGIYLKASSSIEILDEYNGEAGFFIKTFGLNTKRNKNGWRVSWGSIQKRIAEYYNKYPLPGILYTKCTEAGCDLDHTDAATYESSLHVQEPFRVTDIVGHTLDEDNETAYLIHRLTQPHDGIDQEALDRFKQDIIDGTIQFVSPSVWPISGQYDIIKGERMPNGEPIINAYDWLPLHDAFVNDPAFGTDARVTATCEGEDCQVKLLTARQLKAYNENHDADGRFGYSENTDTESPDDEPSGKDTAAPTAKNDFTKKLVLAKSSDGKFETGKPVTFTFAHNTEKAPNMGSRYGQDIEPHGMYVNVAKKGEYENAPNWEKGEATLKNPLVIEHRDTVQWKQNLVEATGKKGSALSTYLQKKGYDGIVTMSTLDNKPYPSETVLLNPSESISTKKSEEEPSDDKSDKPKDKPVQKIKSTTIRSKTNQREQDKMEQNLFPRNKKTDEPAADHPKFISEEANNVIHKELIGDWTSHKDDSGQEQQDFSRPIQEREKFAANVNIPDSELDKAKIPTVADKPELSYDEFKSYQQTEYPDNWKKQGDEAWHVQNYSEGNHIDAKVAAKMEDYETKFNWINGEREVGGDAVKQYFKDNPKAELVNINNQWFVKGSEISTDQRKAIFLEEMDGGKGYMNKLSPDDLNEMVTRYSRIAPLNKDNPVFQKINELDDTKAKAWNDKWQSEWENQKSFFRGTHGTDELDSYIKTGKVGGAGSGYHYMATTSSFETANKFEQGIVIEYDGDSVRNVGKRVTYSVKPTGQGVSSSVNDMETMDRPMAFRYANELETRIPEGTDIENLGIKRIYADPTKLGIKTEADAKKFESKYSSLTNNFAYMKMDSYAWREATLNKPDESRVFKPSDFGAES